MIRNITNQLLETEKKKWNVLVPSDFKGKRKAGTDKENRNIRQKISVQERDNVMISGLSMSIGSHIKSIAESDVDIYSEKDDKEKYFICIGMNNILDTTDESAGSQMDTLSDQQTYDLKRLIQYNPDFDDWMNEEDKKNFNFLEKTKINKNYQHVFNKIDARARVCSQEKYHIYQIFRHFVELHYYESHLFSELYIKSFLSEADYIIKFWGRAIELLFRGSQFVTHW